MDYASLLGGALQGGMGIANQAASGNTKGLGQNVGSTAGGLLGTAFGGPLGSAVGTAAGGLLGGGLQQLIGGMTGGGKKKKGPRKKALHAASKAPKVKQAVQAVAAAQGLPPAKAAAKLGTAAKVVGQVTAARRQATDLIGAHLGQSAAGYSALAKAAGISPAAALQAGIAPGVLVRRAGLERLGQVAGMGGSAQVAKALGIPPELVRALGLQLSHADRSRLAPLLSQAVRMTVARAPSRPRRRAQPLEVQLSGWGDGPRQPRPKGGPLPSVEGDIPAPRTPGAVPVRREQWRLDRGEYVVAPGDTFVGLAATYLGSGGRWPELYKAQSAAYREAHEPGDLGVGTVLVMPAEAVQNAKALLAAGPGSKVAPNGQIFGPLGDVLNPGLPSWALPAAVVGGVVVLGAVVYAASK